MPACAMLTADFGCWARRPDFLHPTSTKPRIPNTPKTLKRFHLATCPHARTKAAAAQSFVVVGKGGL